MADDKTTQAAQSHRLSCDVLIIGGGTAGCFAALTLAGRNVEGAGDAKSPTRTLENAPSVIVLEKANIERSGCLAAGVNALNAYITDGHVPQDYVDYARKDACGIVRGDLLLSMCERLNHVTRRLEELGLVILKDADGNYVSRAAPTCAW